MKRWLGKSALLVMCLLQPQNEALAYKVTTHEDFSEYAANNSVLGTDPTLLSDYGLSPYGTIEFTSTNNIPMHIQGIVAFGSNFEDDGPSILNPFADWRFLRHFFDPQSGSGLLYFNTSPDWALERDVNGTSLDLQSYSYKDARDTFFAAFTCQTSACRLANFSKTFQTIGHVIHHLQDMGQPQHTRLDIHFADSNNIIDNPDAFYELYTAKKIDNNLVSFMNTQPYAPPAAGTNYFSRPRSYWQSGDGKGMAEFSGTKFVTIGTTFTRDSSAATGFSNAPGFPEPSGAGITKITRFVTLTGIGGESLTGDIDFLEGTIVDPLNGVSTPDVKLATTSMLDAHLNSTTSDTITVNSAVFDDRYPLLIPRIAAFSTDFINYFFRGRIDMVEISGEVNSWKIVNNSPEAMSGRFDLYYEKNNGKRTLVTGWNLAIPAGGSSTPVTFQPPTATVSNYALVFRGQLGNESDAVTGKVLDLNVCTENCAVCGTPLTPSGGQSNQPQQYSYNVSSEFPQDLTGFFEAYNIPDQMQVYGNGNLLFDTGGLVSGLSEFSIAYNPSVHGSSLDVIVNAPNNGTAWNFCMDCNSSASTCGLFNAPVSIQGQVTGSGSGCTAKAVFSGRTPYTRNISYFSNPSSFNTNLLPGQYNLELQNFSTRCTLGTTSKTVTLSIFLNGKFLTVVDFLSRSSTFYVPAIPNLE